jgi:hypothetical protein
VLRSEARAAEEAQAEAGEPAYSEAV